MKPTISIRLALVAALSAVLLVPAMAEARERATTVSNAKGQSATRHVNRSAGNVQSSTTTATGQTLSTRTVDRSAASTTSTVTGPQGNTATTSRQTTKTEDGSTTTVTGPKGGEKSLTVTR